MSDSEPIFKSLAFYSTVNILKMLALGPLTESRKFYFRVRTISSYICPFTKPEVLVHVMLKHFPGPAYDASYQVAPAFHHASTHYTVHTYMYMYNYIAHSYNTLRAGVRIS